MVNLLVVILGTDLGNGLGEGKEVLDCNWFSSLPGGEDVKSFFLKDDLFCFKLDWANAYRPATWYHQW